MEEPKGFKVGDVVTSEHGVSNVLTNTRRDSQPIEVLFPNGIYVWYTKDGRTHKNAPITLFHGKGKVDITFTPKLEPVYEYQWLFRYDSDGAIGTTDSYYKTEQEALGDYHDDELLERLDKYKREVK